MRKIGIGAFLANALPYLVIVAFVLGSLFRDFVLGETVMQIHLFETVVHPILFLFPIIYFALVVQRNLSVARGFGRFVDWLISFSMLVVIGAAVAIWAGLPFVASWIKDLGTVIGITLETAPDTYRLAVAVIFGVPALLDVLGRDMLGFFRGGGGAGVSVGDGSMFEASVTPRVKLNSPWDLELPNGRVMQFTPPPDMLARFESEVVRRLPNPGTPPAAAGV